MLDKSYPILAVTVLLGEEGVDWDWLDRNELLGRLVISGWLGGLN
jgi:hypothetical protein